MRKQPFTLIEMLVVISIITILAALLSPSLHKAVKRARATNCASQMRNIGTAYYMYASDWNNYYPPANIQCMSEWHFKNGKEKTFPHFLGGYMGYSDFYEQKYGSSQAIVQFRKSPFMCTDYPYTGTLTMFCGGYAVNIRTGSYEKNANNAWNGSGICHRVASIKSPGTITHLGERWGAYNLNVSGVTLSDIENHRSANMDLQRHLNGCNILFFDNHVKWYAGIDIVNNFDKAYRLGGTIK